MIKYEIAEWIAEHEMVQAVIHTLELSEAGIFEYYQNYLSAQQRQKGFDSNLLGRKETCLNKKA